MFSFCTQKKWPPSEGKVGFSSYTQRKVGSCDTSSWWVRCLAASWGKSLCDYSDQEYGYMFSRFIYMGLVVNTSMRRQSKMMLFQTWVIFWVIWRVWLWTWEVNLTGQYHSSTLCTFFIYISTLLLSNMWKMQAKQNYRSSLWRHWWA